MSEDKFRYTKTGIIGVKRGTMLENQLHHLPELGKPMFRGGKNPGDDFVYGMAIKGTDGGVSEAMVWREQDLKEIEKSKIQERDFVAMNKAAAETGLVTAKEQQSFRKNNDIRKLPRAARSAPGKAKGVQFPSNMVFGKSTRPSTPIYDLLEHRFADEWVQGQRETEMRRRAKEERFKKTSHHVYETRATILRHHKEPVAPKPLWKMSRFEKVQGHLDTFGEAKKHELAFSRHYQDGIAREGLHHDGVYVDANH